MVDALLVELQDTRKATATYISSCQGEYYWGNTTSEDCVAGLHKMAVNDPAERPVGALTGQLQSFGRIGLTYTVGVSQECINGDLSRGFETSSSNKSDRAKKAGVIPYNTRGSPQLSYYYGIRVFSKNKKVR